MGADTVSVRDQEIPMRNWALAEIRRIAARVLAGRPARVWLIGSMARGDWKRGSDIDIAVDPGGADDDAILTLRGELDESDIPFRVDVFDVRKLSAATRTAIDGDKIEWTL